MEEKLGRFGHHPDPVTDFCVEVESLYGMAYDRQTKFGAHPDFHGRFDRALDFRVGGDPVAVAAKNDLWDLDRLIRAGAPITYPKDWHPKQQSDARR